MRVLQAERTRFELVKHFRRLHAFQACLFNHSSTSPIVKSGAKVQTKNEFAKKIYQVLN